MRVERRFPLAQGSFYLREDFLFVDISTRLGFGHPLGFGDPGFAIGDVFIMEAVRIGPSERGVGIPDLPIENAAAVPAPFVVRELVVNGYEVVSPGGLGLKHKVLLLRIPESDLRSGIAFRCQGKQQAVFFWELAHF